MLKFGKPRLNRGKYMSKIGKQPVKLPEGVTAEISRDALVIKGPKASLTRSFPKVIKIENKEGNLIVSLTKNSSSLFPVYGTSRALIANMVRGVTDGWKKVLELVGAGYRAEVSGRTLTLNVGYSHPVKIEAPEGISFAVEKMLITVEGADRELVGQIAANIRAIRPPEPYKGKGIKYQDEVVRRKAGKAAKTAGPV